MNVQKLSCAAFAVTLAGCNPAAENLCFVRRLQNLFAAIRDGPSFPAIASAPSEWWGNGSYFVEAGALA